MKRLACMTMTLSVLALILSAVNAAGTGLPTISYQGYLTDASGTPVNGTVSMSFGLYTAPAGTAMPLWTETQNYVQVTKGVYAVQLGSVTPLNISFDQPYWLGVKVGNDAEMTPRQALASVG